MGLTPKQEKFVQGLFKGLSQRQAYKEAFDASEMKDETIDKKACKLNKDEKIRGRLKELQQEVTNDSKWTLEKMIKEFEAVKEKCMQEVEVMEYNKNTRQMEGTGEYKFEYNGVIKSLENIGKLLGLYTKKIKHSGEIKTTNPLAGLTTEELKKLADIDG